jgi:uncharacterized protein YbjQ (UPF0145 family)
MSDAPPPPSLSPHRSSPHQAIVCITASTWQGASSVQYLGLVTGEAILGANVFKDLFAGIRDIVGGRSAAYERELNRAREIAMDEMRQQAAFLGANAIIAVDLDYETVGQSMLMVSASGTAAIVR